MNGICIIRECGSELFIGFIRLMGDTGFLSSKRAINVKKINLLRAVPLHKVLTNITDICFCGQASWGNQGRRPHAAAMAPIKNFFRCCSEDHPGANQCIATLFVSQNARDSNGTPKKAKNCLCFYHISASVRSSCSSSCIAFSTQVSRCGLLYNGGYVSPWTFPLDFRLGFFSWKIWSNLLITFSTFCAPQTVANSPYDHERELIKKSRFLPPLHFQI